jgi:hypothetical protein
MGSLIGIVPGIELEKCSETWFQTGKWNHTELGAPFRSSLGTELGEAFISAPGTILVTHSRL